MSQPVKIPIIDVSPLFGTDAVARKATALEIGKACREIGFFVIVGHQVPPEIIDKVWSSTKSFFDLPVDEKLPYDKPQHEYPFGYTKFGGEVLSVGKAAENGNSATQSAPPDLKEMFSLGPENPAAGFPAREFPSVPVDFEEAWTIYYRTIAELARTILGAFAIALELSDEKFFDSFIDKHASALRAINYPAIESSEDVLPGQLRASAHTDYGTMTILKSDGPGLQVSKDKDPPVWVDVPHVEGAFVINLGDLMRRWSNDEWLSTLHRVVIPSDEVSSAWSQAAGAAAGTGASSSEVEASQAVKQVSKRRQSLAFFHNVNKDAVVEVLLRGPAAVPKHAPIVAGDFLMQKHLASVGATPAASSN